MNKACQHSALIFVALLIWVIPLRASFAAPFSFEVVPKQTITDNGCPTTNNFTINVTDDFKVSDLNVGLAITHAYRSDLDVTLRSPAGTSVALFTDVGGSGANLDILLDDEAGTDIGSLGNTPAHTVGTSFYENVFNPEGSAVLSAFDGENAIGVWTLSICDDESPDAGTMERILLQFDGVSNIVAVPGHILGTVFQDFDSDGVKDSASATDQRTDAGVAGVTVTAYDANGATYSAVTDSSGAYNINASAGTGPFRVEFTTLPTNFYPTFHQSNSGSNSSAPNSTGTTAGATVQFLPASVVSAGAANVNLGVNEPCDYCQNDPYMATPVAMGGDQTSSTYTLKTSDAIKVFKSSVSGTSPSVVQGASQQEVATTYGQAYDRMNKKLYTAAYIKRHTGLTAGGAGQIFRTDLSNPAAPGAPAAWVTIPNVGFSSTNSSRGLPANPATVASRDTLVMSAVGKAGLGDIEISDDLSTLYAMNLYDKSIYPVDTKTGTVGTPIVVPAATCTQGVWRPFALKVRRGTLYAGGVCDGSGASATTLNLSMQIFPYDLVTKTWGAGLFAGNGASLDYDGVAGNADRGCGLVYSQQGYTPPPPVGCSWEVWNDSLTTTDTFGMYGLRPMPMLTDIEFDQKNNLVLGLRDRWGDLTGYKQCTLSGSGSTCSSPNFSGISVGDILRATPSGSVWVLETLTPQRTEFFTDDEIVSTIINSSGNERIEHQETALGSLAYQPGATGVASTLYDPLNLYSAGVTWFSNDTGQAAQEVELVANTDNLSLFGKGNGLGDIEYLCDPALIEIGNRVWVDSDGDGIQDPNEAPISGVIVELYKNGVKIGQTTTDALGEYYFTSGTNATDANTNDNVIHNNGVGIIPGTGVAGGNSEYEIRIPNVIGGSKQAVLGVNGLTQANAMANDSIDSDGSIPGGQTYASYSIPYADLGSFGYNHHTYDFGFAPPQNVDIALVKTLDKSTARHGDTVVYTLTASNTSSTNASGVQVTDMLPAGLSYVADDGAGAYDHNSGLWNIGNLGAGANAVLNITAQVN